MDRLAIGIDIGGQSSKCGVVTEDGTILYQSVVTSLIDNFDEYLKLLADTVRDMVRRTADRGTVVGIGIGAPNANRLDGTIRYAPNLKWARDAHGNPTVIHLAKRLKEATGLHVRITNDANAAARGEHTYGVARGINDFIMITLGTGVGSGIIESLLRNLDPEKISSKDIYDAAVQGDQLAKEIFAFTGRILGRAMGDFVKFSSPKAIVLFGGLTKSREFFHDEMVKAMNDNLMQIWKNKIQILYSSLKESDAAILGASSMVWSPEII